MVEAEISKADMTRFNAAMQRFQTEFGKSPLSAVKWAAANLARSLRAGTKSAKEFPQVQATRGSGRDRRKYWQAFNDIHGRLEHLKWRQKVYRKADVKRRYRRSRFGLQGGDHPILDKAQIALRQDQDAGQQDQTADDIFGNFHFFLCHGG